MPDNEFLQTCQQQVDSLVKYHKRYQMLLTAMENDAFDDDDRKLVKQRLTHLEQSLEEMKNKVQNREKVYETSVKQLMQILATRQEILENVDEKTNLFAVDEELLHTLADRQKELTQKLKDLIQEISALPE